MEGQLVTDHSAQPAPIATPAYSIRAVGGAELGFVLSSWTQSHMRSPGQPLGELYMRLIRPNTEQLLAREDVWIIGAFGPFDGKPDAILGWLAWTPGELPTVHYAYVRGALRKRGIFNDLLDKAMVGRRFIVTHKGQIPKYKRRNAPTYDKRVISALERRGIAAVYVPIGEWLERMR
jgi:hypothetical protein